MRPIEDDLRKKIFILINGTNSQRKKRKFFLNKIIPNRLIQDTKYLATKGILFTRVIN